MRPTSTPRVAWWLLLMSTLQGGLVLIQVVNELASFSGFALTRPWVVALGLLSLVWVAAAGAMVSATRNPNLWADIATRNALPIHSFQRLTALAACCVPSSMLIVLGMQRALDNNIGWLTSALLVVGTGVFWLMYWWVLRSGTGRAQAFTFPLNWLARGSIAAALVFAVCSHPAVNSRLPWVKPYTIVIARFTDRAATTTASDSSNFNQLIISKMTEQMADRADILIKPLEESFTSPAEARARGRDYNAAIVIWGDYIAKQFQSTESADVNVHIETLCLTCPIEVVEQRNREPRQFRGAEGFDIEVSLTNEFRHTSLFVLAVAEREAGRHASSMNALTSIIDQRSEFSEISAAQQSMVYYHRGLARDALDQPDGAYADIEESLKLDPNNALAAHWYAYMLYNKGQYNDSVRYYEQAWQAGADARCQHFFGNLGNAYYMAGQYTEALASYKRALGTSGPTPIIYRQLGVTYHALGDYPQARADLTEAIELSHGDPEAYIYADRARAHSAQQDYARAIADWDEALRLTAADPDPVYYEERAAVYEASGDHTRAMADYEQAAELAPTSERFGSLGRRYYADAQYALALTAFDTALRIDPQSAAYLNDRGNTYAAINQLDRAAHDFTLALARDPTYVRAYNGLAGIALRRGDDTTAFAHYAEAIAREPAFADTYRLRSLLHERRQEYPDALSDAEQWALRAPHDALASFRVGLLRYNQGQYEEAIVAFGSAIALDPTLDGAYRNRGLCYSATGDDERALADANTAIALNAAFATAYEDRGRIFARRDELALARESFEQALALTADEAARTRIQQQLATLP